MFFFFFKQKTAYEISACLVGSEMCIRDRYMGFKKYQEEFFDFMRLKELDVLITPGQPTPAIKHSKGSDLMIGNAYCYLFNALTAPGGVVPITKVAPGEDKYEDPKNNDIFVSTVADCMNGTVGLPVGVQVVGRPYEDELVLNVMHQLEESVDFHEYPNV
eukprot:TRINITY_DN11430_c0_g1_i6.p1 TRINITY_DN11430_c0_g1~~TRINITY_DN11430_c0_g1_i6.p1  ORF type:complete len:160 (+),score=44.55 TRINITY_DN11430_c0_g1_i6:28-507(+)